jgi:hypothetical protein
MANNDIITFIKNNLTHDFEHDFNYLLKELIHYQSLIGGEEIVKSILDIIKTDLGEEGIKRLKEIETKAFNDGKGVGLIIGTGGNATNDANMGSAIVEQKECPTNFVANNRKISLCEASFFYQALYNNHFIVAEQPEA